MKGKVKFMEKKRGQHKRNVGQHRKPGNEMDRKRMLDGFHVLTWKGQAADAFPNTGRVSPTVTTSRKSEKMPVVYCNLL